VDKLKLNMWASGKLISIATAFSNLLLMPSISELFLHSKACIMFEISAGLVQPR
jgi:hypothetical protein